MAEITPLNLIKEKKSKEKQVRFLVVASKILTISVYVFIIIGVFYVRNFMTVIYTTVTAVVVYFVLARIVEIIIMKKKQFIRKLDNQILSCYKL
ncbi:MAG: hypothetical protein JXR05_16020 [Flavobacteriaceae bacterium]